MGFKKGDKIGILSQNRVEWTVVDIACGALGVILVPLYDTQSLKDCEHVCKLVELKYVFIELTKMQKYGPVLQNCGIQLFIFDDALMERHFLWDNKEQFKFTLPSTVTTVEKPHSYYAQISEIYTHEK